MNCSRARDLIPDLAAGSLDSKLEAEVRAHIQGCPACAEDLQSLTQTLNLLDAMPTPKPSSRVRQSVYAAIEQEKRAVASSPVSKPKSARRSLLFWILQPVAACALIALGFLVGERHEAATAALPVATPASVAKADPSTQQQIAALQEKVDTMTQLVGYSLAKNSTNDRIAKVLTTGATLKPGEQVINNLITTMTLDPSANVRLNAVEALYAHADDPLVKAAVVSSLTHEASPIVQLALIDFVVGAHDHEAIPELQKLLSSEQTDTNVRDAAKTAIPQL